MMHCTHGEAVVEGGDGDGNCCTAQRGARRPGWGAALIALGLGLVAGAGRASAAPPAPEEAPAAEPAGEAAPATAGAATWTWDAVVAEVLKTHPLMKAAKADLATFEAKLSQADWAWFPAFKLEAGATITPQVTGTPLQSDTDWGTIGYFASAKLEMVQPVWTFGKIEALKRAAAAGLDVSRAQMAAARWELVYRIGQAYMGKLLARELRGIMDVGRTWIDKAEERMERLREQDSMEYDQLEHLRLKTRLAEFYMLDAESKLLETRSAEGLRVLLSLPPGAEVTLSEQALVPTRFEMLTADEYVRLAMANEPTLQVGKAGIVAQRALADSKEAEIWPDLVIVGSVAVADAPEIENQQSRFANDPYNTSSAGALLGLRWNLDVPQRVFRADEARAKALKTEYDVEVQKDLVEVKVRQLAQDLANKRELIDVLATAQKAAQGWLTATWDTYDAGFGNFRDYMDALVQFYTRKVGYLQMVYDHNVLVMELSRAVGVDIRTVTAADVPAGR
ncbi:MAG: TolC family protein [Myxococcales bacterium]|nr:TolC family protein [Myxococcales bacterium]